MKSVNTVPHGMEVRITIVGKLFFVSRKEKNKIANAGEVNRYVEACLAQFRFSTEHRYTKTDTVHAWT